QFRECFRRLDRLRHRRPLHILVTLLVESSVDRNAADLPGCLKSSKCNGKRGRDSLLLPFFSEAARRGADHLANALDIERVLAQLRDDRVAKLVDLLHRDADLLGCSHLALAELSCEAECDAEVTCRNDIGAGASRWQLVNLQRGDRT